MAVTYKKAGVDVEAGDQLVDWLQKDMSDPSNSEKSPHQDRLISGIGGFAALFRASFPELKKPCLVSATDGVGTKIKLAALFSSYQSVGQDLVAMCVNDLVCCGAQPLFFLDYYASGKLNLDHAKDFLTGVRQACEKSECLLIGGETAEMPGLYHGDDFDAAGFAVGIVDEDEILGAKRVHEGMVVLGVSSSGFHSNGYSLLREVFAADLQAWQESLMTPTHLYARLVLDLNKNKLVQAVAHITGGGMENIPRVMPRGTVLSLMDWAWPAEFLEVQDRSGLSRVEMLKTFNCGVGLALFVRKENVNRVIELIQKHDYTPFHLGQVTLASDLDAEPEVSY